MDSPSTFHIIEYCVSKSQIHNPYTPEYMEVLSIEHADEYYKAVDDEIQSLMRRDIWEVVSRKSFSDHNVLLGTWSFKCNRKPGCNISKFKA